jgi:hypothetical protein
MIQKPAKLPSVTVPVTTDSVCGLSLELGVRTLWSAPRPHQAHPDRFDAV